MACLVAEVPAETAISLSPEHDRFVWLPLPDAAALVAPATVRESWPAQRLAGCK